MSATYADFIASKAIAVPEAGFAARDSLAPLFPFQRRALELACKRGRSALFLDTGLGKTIVQLEWARQVHEHTGRKVLLLAPLAVAQQTVREAAKFGLPAVYARDASEVGPVTVTNYERLAKFGASAFAGVVLDESSILKNYSGATKEALVSSFASTPYRLACTATPAPNDHLELGNHAEFLGVMSSHQMIARWFINDTSSFGTYRLKGHAVESFWDWVSSWSVMGALPSDVGSYDDSGYVLPELVTRHHVVEADLEREEGSATLFRIVDLNATSIHKERRRTASARAAKVAALIAAEPDEQWCVWSESDYEADALLDAIPGAVDVRGSDTLESKERSLLGFCDGSVRYLITKPKLAGMGLNWQHAARVAFVGATFSFEAYYQAIRRMWRFGQKRAVHVHVVMAQTEKSVWDILAAKRDGFDSMKAAMFDAARRARMAEAKAGTYVAGNQLRVPPWLVSEARP